MGGKTAKSISISSVRQFFVVNPACFDSHQKMEAVIAEIHRFFNGLDNLALKAPPDYAVHVSRFPRDAIGAIRRFANAVPSGAPLRVYAVGGDGILFDCLNGVMGLPNVELGIMPYGKENDFYCVFREKNRNIFNFLERQVCAPSVPMDVLYCGSSYALSRCLIGLEPFSNPAIKAVRRSIFMDRIMPDFSRILSVNFMCLVGAMNFSAHKQHYSVWVDGVNLSGLHILIHIMNSPWYNGSIYHPCTDPTDGYFDMVATGDLSLLEMVKAANNYVSALRKAEATDDYMTNDYERLLIHRRAKKALITSASPLVINLDGELFYDKCLSVEIKPAAVRIIVPGPETGVRP